MSRARRSGFAALLEDYRQYAGGELWLALGLMLLGGLAEGFGLITLVPLVSMALGEKHVPLRLFAPLARMAPDQRFLAALALFLLAMTARSGLLYLRDIRMAALENGYEASLRLRAAATLSNRGWTFASRVGQAGLQSLLLNDIPRVGHAVAMVQVIWISAAMLAVQLALTAMLSIKLTLVALLLLAAGALLAGRRTRRGARSGRTIVERMEETTGSAIKLHGGLKAAMAQGTVVPFLDEYQASLETTRAEFMAWARDFSGARHATAFAAAVAAALLLFVGLRVLALPFPILITTLVLFARMSGPAQIMQQSVHQLAADAPAFDAIQRRLGALEWPDRQQPPAPPLDWSELRVENVAFEHQPRLGLAGASLVLRRGEWIGITGPSGAGKTTLVDLVAGLLSAQSGLISIDGTRVEGELADRWRSSLAYVGQEALVFNDSVRGNLLAEGARASDAELWSALDTVGLAGRVHALPNGLDQRVGDRGSELSGGQRQRLVLARALLRHPTLLILDEATAALDESAERAVLVSLKSLAQRPAALIVAHRESTLGHCDSRLDVQHAAGKSGE